MTGPTRKVVIAGTGYSQVGRHLDQTAGSLAVDACRTALAEAGMPADAVDGLAVFPYAGHTTAGSVDGVDFVSSDYIADAVPTLNLRWRASIQPGDFASSVVTATHAIASGSCDTVLVWRAMHNPHNVVYGKVGSETARDEYEFTAPYGVGDAISKFAFPYSRYMSKYGASRDHMATFIVQNRANAAKNPDAVFCGKEVNREDYLRSHMIIEPFSMLDCDMPVDGAGAVLLTTESNARSALYDPVYVAAGSSGTTSRRNRLMVLLEDHERGARALADALWSETSLSPNDLDTANLYDGFSYFTYLYMEAFGVCRKGEAFEFIQDGRIGLDGSFPLNTSGGNLGMGRLHGTPQVIESVRQIQRRAKDRQIGKADVVLAVTGQPHYCAGSLLLTKETA
jgi:acetyl-CoA acetyltransferase